MFMFVAYPWPVPSANVEPAGFNPAGSATAAAAAAAAAVAHPPDALAETRTLRPAQVEELICWTRRERLRLVWYRLRLAARGIYRPSRRARQSRLNANRG